MRGVTASVVTRPIRPLARSQNSAVEIIRRKWEVFYCLCNVPSVGEMGFGVDKHVGVINNVCEEQTVGRGHGNM